MHMPAIRLSTRVFTWAMCLCALSASAGERPRPFFVVDESARQVPLFDGMEEGVFEVRLILQDEFGGNLLVTNVSDQPLNMQMPDAIVGVEVAPQQPFGGGMQGGGGGQQGGGQGQNQGVGGGGQQGGGQQGGGQQGFFSIPPEETLRVPFTSVCLDHGKHDPHPRANYTIIPVDEYTQDKELQELIRLVGTGQLDPAAAQAAAWHLDDGMSWAELASKTYSRFGGIEAPYFTYDQLMGAQQVVAAAQVLAEERADEPAVEPAPAVVKPDVAVTGAE